jgi:hypothetical protein
MVPVVGGTPGARVYLSDVSIPISVPESAPLEYLPSRGTRFCSYRHAIFLEQGEPAIAPSPVPTVSP